MTQYSAICNKSWRSACLSRRNIEQVLPKPGITTILSENRILKNKSWGWLKNDRILFYYIEANIVCVLVFSIMLIHNHFNIDRQEKQIKFGYALVAFILYIYMGTIVFYTVRKAKATENPAEKRKHLFVGFFPLMTIAGGLVEMVFFPKAPIFCFTAMILMLIFYIQFIEQRVSQDPLTGLNNRGQLARYCSQASNLHLDGRMTVVIMMDIDRFKSINDTYGHAEGDKALVIVSSAMKAIVNQHSMPSFLCRYGGDEFIIIIHPAEMVETTRLIQEIRDEIDRNEGMFPLSVSAGYDTLCDIHDTIQDCIIRADSKLYEDKKRLGIPAR